MTIELTERTQVRAFWSVGGRGMDMLAAVYKPEGEQWKAFYRFRYYVDGKAFDSADRKTFFELAAPDVDTLVNAIEMVAALTAQTFGGTVERVDINGTGIDALEKLAAKSWIHTKIDGAPDA